MVLTGDHLNSEQNNLINFYVKAVFDSKSKT